MARGQLLLSCVFAAGLSGSPVLEFTAGATTLCVCDRGESADAEAEAAVGTSACGTLAGVTPSKGSSAGRWLGLGSPAVAREAWEACVGTALSLPSAATGARGPRCGGAGWRALRALVPSLLFLRGGSEC